MGLVKFRFLAGTGDPSHEVVIFPSDPLQPSVLSKSWVAFSNLLICRYGKLSFNKKVK